MDGVINVLKPPGMTSHDVVLHIRRLLKVKKAGHTGTLDPGAAGVLPVCVGQATRIAEYLTDATKAYRAEITLGITTDSHDAFGRVVSTASLPDITPEKITRVLDSFRGQISQVPPMLSAVQIGGQRLYELARAGMEVDRPPRKVQIFSLTVVKWELHRSPPRFLFDVECSKGTYIRTLCHDIGSVLGCGAYMSFLVRTRVGGLVLSEALTLEELAKARDQGKTDQVLLPLERALSRLSRFTLPEPAARRIRHGCSVPYPVTREIVDGTHVCVLGPGGNLLAIARVTQTSDGTVLKPVKVFTNSGGDGA